MIHPKMKILSWFAHPYLNPKLYNLNTKDDILNDVATALSKYNESQMDDVLDPTDFLCICTKQL